MINFLDFERLKFDKHKKKKYKFYKRTIRKKKKSKNEILIYLYECKILKLNNCYHSFSIN
jgi:hypothetical protein